MTEPTTGMSSERENIHWPSLFAAISSITAVGIAIGLGLPLLSTILQNRGISSTMIGLNSAMAGVAAMIAAPITTRVAKRLGTAPTMIWAIVLAAVSAMGFYFAENFLLWFPLRLVFHGAITTLFILSEFWINVAAPPKKRGLVLGIYATVLSFGFAAGPQLFSLLGSRGIEPFLVGSIIILLASIPIFIARHESPVLEAEQEYHFARYIFLVPTATAAVFIFGAVEAGGLSLFSVFATGAGLSEPQWSQLLSIMGIGNIVFQIPLGLLSDRMKDKRPLLTILALVGLIGSLMMPSFAQNWYLMALILFLWGGSVSGLYTVGLSHLGSRLKGSDLAAANAAFLFCYAVGTVAGPQAIGAAIDATGNNGFAWSIASFFAIYVMLSIGRLIFRSKLA